MISYKRDVRGTVIDSSWEGECLEPGVECPTSCKTDADFTTQTCYQCDVEASCEGRLCLLPLHRNELAKRTEH